MKQRSRRLLFIDGSSGASGDMLLGALVDLGASMAAIRRVWSSLPVSGWTARSRRIERCALVGRKIDIKVRGAQPGRRFEQIERVVKRGKMEPSVRRRSLAIFRRLIEAEATVHGRSAEEVHLHEAGGVDAILDVVGTCAALEQLKVDRIVVSPLTTGFGEVDCDHGRYPVPGPATLALIRGVPVQAGTLAVERLTPTGAAILTAVCDDWGPMPAMRPSRVGYGAGSRDLGSTPNYLRAILGDEAPAAPATGEAAVIECTLDDMTPQALAHACGTLLACGALDVFTTPANMKKGRPGQLLTVLARPEQVPTLAERIFRETSTLGLRYRIDRRLELEREILPVRTRFGKIRVKIGRMDGAIVQLWPEYEDCAACAEKRGVALQEVQQEALRAYRDQRGD